MEYLIDSCVWIDHLRPATPARIRELTRDLIGVPGAVTCEPIMYELLRSCAREQRRAVEVRLASLPLLATPADLWTTATLLSQRCRDAGLQAGYSDLLIATVCRHHGATLVTFDEHFARLSKLLGFEAKLIDRAT